MNKTELLLLLDEYAESAIRYRDMRGRGTHADLLSAFGVMLTMQSWIVGAFESLNREIEFLNTDINGTFKTLDDMDVLLRIAASTIERLIDAVGQDGAASACLSEIDKALGA
jgi:hypothetical protein